MEKQFKLDYNGQQVQQQDFADIGESAGLADDRVFAELFRLAPYDGSTVSRGILPYLYTGASGSIGTVAPNGATGQVKVKPFRAMLGSRTAVATEARKNWRDVRSGLSVAEGATSADTLLTLGANSSGNPRWDLVYAAITPDANGSGATRKVKDATTRVVTPTPVVPNLVTTVTVGVTAGTPAATPTMPAAPTDSAGTYYIPLAYVRVPNGFGAGSTVANADIYEVAPVLGLSRAAGASICRPANSHNKVGGAAISGTGTSQLSGTPSFKFGATAGQRAELYMPPSMQGGEVLLIAFELCGLSANWSHQNDDVLDNTRDWRNRLFKWQALIGNGTTLQWAFNAAYGSGTILDAGYMPLVGQNFTGVGGGNAQMVGGFGQSFWHGGGHNVASIATAAGAYWAANVTNPPMAAAAGIGIGVNLTPGHEGELKLTIEGSPGVWGFIWLEATGQFDNY